MPKIAGKMPPSVFDSRGSPDEKLPQPARIDARPGRRTTARWPDRRGRCRASRAPSRCRRPPRATTRVREACVDHLASRASASAYRALSVGQARARVAARVGRDIDGRARPRAARPRSCQPLGLDLGVDRADLVALDVADAVAIGLPPSRSAAAAPARPHRRRSPATSRSPSQQADRRADERPVLPTLDVDRLARQAPAP